MTRIEGREAANSPSTKPPPKPRPAGISPEIRALERSLNRYRDFPWGARPIEDVADFVLGGG